jgi:serine/threonine-protein kinase
VVSRIPFCFPEPSWALQNSTENRTCDSPPENIMVSQDGLVKVIDFGVAKALGGFGPQTRTGIIKGKLAYMAPEQVAQKVLPATDVFGAGIVLHELLTGRRLFGGSNEYLVVSRVLKAEIPRPSSLNPSVPKELDDVTMQALSRDLRGRFVDGNAMADALTRVLDTVPALSGTNNQTIRDWVKKLTTDAKQFAQGWEEQESGLHVDVQNALAHSVAKGEDLVELDPSEMLVEGGVLDPGVKAAVTMGLRTLRPDMLKQPPAKRPSSNEAMRPPPLPGARPAANRVSSDAMAQGLLPAKSAQGGQRVSADAMPQGVVAAKTPLPGTEGASAQPAAAALAPAKSPARGILPQIAAPTPDPAASTIETSPAPISPAPVSSASMPTLPPPAKEPLPPYLAAIEQKLPPVIRSALQDGQIFRLAVVISVLILVLLLLLLVALFR